MAKKVKVMDKRKIRGIRRRWLINSVGVVLLVLVLALGSFSAAIWSYYYSSTINDLKRRAESTAGGFASYTRSQYWTNAQSAVQRFEEKTKMELQFLDTSGSVQYSSNDLAAGTTPDTPDIQEALTNQDTRPWMGTDPDTKERIVAVSSPIVYHGQTVAVVRYVTSLVAIDRQFILAVGLACLLGIVVLSLVYFSNLYFVRSIVEPLASITETARLIADGSYGVQIEKKYDDEVGELTDTINDMSLKIKQSEKTQSEFISSVSHPERRAEKSGGRAEGNGHHRVGGPAADQYGGGAAGIFPHLGRPLHLVRGALGSEGGAGGRGVYLSGVFPPGGD